MRSASSYFHISREGRPTLNPQPTALKWWKAEASTNNGSCVEVAVLPDGGVAVRDSKDQDGAVLQFTQAEWVAFATGMAAGDFDSLIRS